VFTAELCAEIARIISDLDYRRPFLRDTWSRHRDRGPFLDTLVHRWRELPSTDLLCLDPITVAHADAFFRALHDFELYIRFTEDMPEALLSRFDRSLDRLRDLGAALIDSLGGPQETELVEFEVDQPQPQLFKGFERQIPASTDEINADDWAEETRKAMAALYELDEEPSADASDQSALPPAKPS